MGTENSLDWELHHIRDAIASDWDALASGKLGPHQRQAVREHLDMNLIALRELKIKRRIASYSIRMRRMLDD
jgi:hypothetical protein